jgi:replicative DNA helicase
MARKQTDSNAVRDPVAERVLVASVVTDATGICLQQYLDSGCTIADFTDPNTALVLQIYLAAYELRGAASLVDILQGEHALKNSAFGQFAVDLTLEAATDCTAYARSVRIHAEQRKAMAQIERHLRRAAEASDPEERIEAMAAAKAVHVPQLEPTKSLTKAERLAAMYAEDLSGVEKLPAIPTSLQCLDNTMAGGFRAGRLYVLAARPGGGKTSLALGMVAAACRAGKRVAFISLEMQGEELERRMISYLSGVPLLGNRAATVDEAIALQQAYATLSDWDYHIWDKPPRNYDEVIRWLCALHEEQPLGLVVLDYLQLLPSTGAERDDLSIGQHATRSKNAAKFLGCPFLLIAQPNRAIDQRGDGRYRMSDLRGSGQIEQDADWIAFVWRAPESAEGYPQGYAEIDILKHRHGPLARHRIEWHGPTYRFHDSVEPLISFATGTKTYK